MLIVLENVEVLGYGGGHVLETVVAEIVRWREQGRKVRVIGFCA